MGGAASGTATGLYTSALMVDPANPGADRGNYQISFVNASMRIVSPPVDPNGGSTNEGASQSQTEAQAQLSAQSQANNLVNAIEQSEQSTLVVTIADNPFELASADLLGVGEKICDIGDLSNCRCDVALTDTGNQIDGIEVCYEERE